MSKGLLVGVCAAALCVALAVPLVASGATRISAHLTAGQIVNPNGGDPGATADIKLRVNRVKQRTCTGATKARSLARSSPCSRATRPARCEAACGTCASGSSSA